MGLWNGDTLPAGFPGGKPPAEPEVDPRPEAVGGSNSPEAFPVPFGVLTLGVRQGELVVMTDPPLEILCRWTSSLAGISFLIKDMKNTCVFPVQVDFRYD